MLILKSSNFKLILALLAALILYLWLSLPYYSGDVKNHLVWGTSILQNGTLGFYQREFHDFSFPNYPPVSMLLFAASVWLYNFVYHWAIYLNLKFSFFPSIIIPFLQWENTAISFLKLSAIIPAILTGYLVYKYSEILQKHKEKLVFVFIFLLNPATIYISAIWGQNDFLQVFFLLLAILLLFKEKLWLSFIAAGLAILSKQTVLLLWLVYLLVVFKKYGLLKSFYGFLLSLVLMFILYLPFNNTSPVWPVTFYRETLKTTGNLVSDNAINFWGFITNFQKIDASSLFYGLPLEIWGYLLFTLLFMPLIYFFWKSRFSYERTLHLLFITSSLYFLTLTRMHERYLIPTVVFASVLVLFKKRLYWINLLFFSALQFLNLYRGLYQPDIPILNLLVNLNLLINLLVVSYIILIGVNIYQYFKND